MTRQLNEDVTLDANVQSFFGGDDVQTISMLDQEVTGPSAALPPIHVQEGTVSTAAPILDQEITVSSAAEGATAPGKEEGPPGKEKWPRRQTWRFKDTEVAVCSVAAEDPGTAVQGKKKEGSKGKETCDNIRVEPSTSFLFAERKPGGRVLVKKSSDTKTTMGGGRVERRDQTNKVQMGDLKKLFTEVLDALVQNKQSFVFLDPVDQMLYEDYASIVQKPMDLGTVGKKIEKGAYKTTDGFKDDILLIFSNAKLYNYKTDEIWQSASFLMDTFKRLWPKLEHKLLLKQRPKKKKTIKLPQKIEEKDVHDKSPLKQFEDPLPLPGPKIRRRQSEETDNAETGPEAKKNIKPPQKMKVKDVQDQKPLKQFDDPLPLPGPKIRRRQTGDTDNAETGDAGTAVESDSMVMLAQILKDMSKGDGMHQVQYATPSFLTPFPLFLALSDTKMVPTPAKIQSYSESCTQIGEDEEANCIRVLQRHAERRRRQAMPSSLTPCSDSRRHVQRRRYA